jgi:hypothetical protein
MCELCREDRVEFLNWEPDPDDFCEWRDDEEDDDEEDLDLEEEFGDLLFTCAEPPCFVVRDTFVSEHLCDYHVTNNPDLEPDALAFVESAGLGSSDLLPIGDKRQPCEYGDLLEDSPACGNKADWALIVTAEYLLCEKHAALRRRADKH